METTTINHPGGRINVRVQRSARRTKTVELKVSRDGSLTVLAPLSTPADFIHQFVRDRTDWVIEQIRRFEDADGTYGVADGQTMPFRGVPYPVSWDRGLWSGCYTTWSPDGGFRVDVPPQAGEATVQRAFEKWYRAQFTPIVLDAVAKRWVDMSDGKPPPLLRISNAKKRWGSCSREARVVRFTWRVLMLDDDLLDMVVVHELAHLVHPNHSPQYYAHVARFRPDQRAGHKRLKAASRQIPTW